MNAIAKKCCTPLKVFLGFSLLNLALFLLLIPFLEQKGFDWVVFSLAVLVQAFLTDDMKTIPRFLGFFLLGFCIVLAPIFLYLRRRFGQRFALWRTSGCSRALWPRSCGLCRRRERGTSTGKRWLFFLILSLLMSAMSGNNYPYYRISMIPCYAAPQIGRAHV